MTVGFGYSYGFLICVGTDLARVCDGLRMLSDGPKWVLSEIELLKRYGCSASMSGSVNPVIAGVVKQVCEFVVGVGDSDIVLRNIHIFCVVMAKFFYNLV
ncbi:hypothetical protein ACISOF_09510 [Campylobacter jejuni]